MDYYGIRALLTRLARPDASGGDVIERAAILAAGSDFTEIMAWVMAHGGKAEAPAAPASKRWPARGTDNCRWRGSVHAPLRFAPPPGALAARPAWPGA